MLPAWTRPAESSGTEDALVRRLAGATRVGPHRSHRASGLPREPNWQGGVGMDQGGWGQARWGKTR